MTRKSTEGFLRRWLGGGGFIAGVMMFAVGYTGGPLGLAAFLWLVACVLVAVEMIDRLRESKAVRPQPPAVKQPTDDQDRLWEPDRSTGLLGTVHDALGDIAVTRTMERRIMRVNATFRRLTGKHRPEGRTCEELGIAFRPGAAPNRYDVEIATPGGQRIFAWYDVFSRDPVTGQPIIQSIARDVTDERLAAGAREEARENAEYKNAAKSRLLATVSHELRTPLSGILGMSHLLAQTRLTAEQTSYLAGIRESGDALVQLIGDLLDFSTMEVGRFALSTRAESLRQLLESVVEMLAHRAHEKGIEIGATVAFDVPEMMNLDPARLRQVLFNVIGNAVKFTQTGGVLIRAGLDREDLVITVRDSGPGMTAEEQTRIFGEFEQAGSTLEKSAGTGLGLTISARIIQEFGGSLRVASRKGRGSEFTIRFPASVPAEYRERNLRKGMLKGTRVLLLAPDGPASAAIAETIRSLGGRCFLVEPADTDGFALHAMGNAGGPPTDIIVDHRMAPQFFREFSDRIEIVAPGLRKIFLVNPEERASRPMDFFDAWLIRPLREQSLIDVLRGRMRGMEERDTVNDSQPGFAQAAPEVPAATGLRVVVGEDDPVNAMLVRAILTKAGHDVTLVEDFESLLDRAWGVGGNRPDIVVTDLSMPNGDGIDTLGRLRAHERRQGLSPVPVLVLTADGRDETRRDALLKGADAVVAKPVDPQRFIEDIQALAALSLRQVQEH